MARPKKDTETKPAASVIGHDEDLEAFSADLLKSINRDIGREVAYNLGDGNAPTLPKYWLSSGSKFLDAAIANNLIDPISGKQFGGFPGGRIIEIFGAFASGKSTLAQHIAKNVQRSGGIVVYIDTENATSIQNLQSFGIDVTQRFVFVQPQTIEETFKVADIAIQKAKAMKKDIPVVVIWDSVAATATKAETEGEFEQQFMGVQARALSQGIKKFNAQLVDSKATLILLNQMRQKIGVMFGDPWVTSGGNAIPYYSSVRIALSSSLLKDTKTGQAYGTRMKAKIVKNKVGMSHREVEFELHFGKGIRDDQTGFETFSEYCKMNKEITLPKQGMKVKVDNGGWKKVEVTSIETGEVLHDLSLRKDDVGAEFFYNPKFESIINEMIDVVMHIAPKKSDDDEYFANPTFNLGLSKGADDYSEQ